MDDVDNDEQPVTLMDLAERSTKALERLLLLHQIVLSLAFLGLVIWGIALLGS